MITLTGMMILPAGKHLFRRQVNCGQRKQKHHGRQIPEIKPEEIHTETKQKQCCFGKNKGSGGGEASCWQEEIARYPVVSLESAREMIFPSMKLQQGQVWKCGEQYVRIVHLERLEVGYKSASSRKFIDGKHEHTSKKDFCRLLKGATLVSPAAEKPSPPPSVPTV